MCQQTRVATVVPYYERWMRTFPTVESLAEASEDDVFRLWQGLGYYSRARNLRRAAIQVVGSEPAAFPQTAEALQALPGIGQYTAAAVASIAFGESVGVVDGNVLRVFARFHAIHDDIRLPKNTRQFWALSNSAILPERPGDSNQALMELGALICTPKSPRCEECPVRSRCGAHLGECVSSLPFKSKNPKPRDEHRFAYRIVRDDGSLLVARNPAGSLLGGMWQFPMVIADEAPEAVFAACSGQLARDLERFAPVLHVFSHIRMQVTLIGGRADGVSTFRGYEKVDWLAPDALSDLGTSKLMKKLRAKFEEGQSELGLGAL